MKKLTVADVLAALPQAGVEGDFDPKMSFDEVAYDSRLLNPGALFVALRGERDGHDFIANAVECGASGILAERAVEPAQWRDLAEGRPIAYFVVPDSLVALQQLAAHWRAGMSVEVIGVTGSVGKTSTREILASLLSSKFQVLRNEKNYNNEIGLPLTILSLHSKHEKAVLEMGMYAEGEIRDLCQIAKPRIGVITNVGHSHLERLGSLESIAAAKAELVEALPVDGVAVLNAEDSFARRIAARTRAKVVYFGVDCDCDVRGSEVELHGISGATFRLCYGGEQARVELMLPGIHNVRNALAAAAAALHSGMSFSEVVSALANLRCCVRLQTLPGRNGSTIIDDTYNASPASTLAALDVLSQMPSPHAAILGDMLELGSYEAEGHRLVGHRVAEVAERLVTVGQLARQIADEARANGMLNVREFERSEDVVFEPLEGEQILVKGSRSMVMENVVAKLCVGEAHR